MNIFSFIGSTLSSSATVVNSGAKAVNSAVKSVELSAQVLQYEAGSMLMDSMVEYQEKLKKLDPEMKAKMEELMK